MSRITTVIVFALLATLVVGCVAEPPTEPPGIVGAITTLERTQDGVSMLVEGGSQPEGAVSDKAQVTVTGSTKVFDADGNPAELDALAEGARVTVWFAGAVAESYPVQGTAAAVQLSAEAP